MIHLVSRCSRRKCDCRGAVGTRRTRSAHLRLSEYIYPLLRNMLPTRWSRRQGLKKTILMKSLLTSSSPILLARTKSPIILTPPLKKSPCIPNKFQLHSHFATNIDLITYLIDFLCSVNLLNLLCCTCLIAINDTKYIHIKYGAMLV